MVSGSGNTSGGVFTAAVSGAVVELPSRAKLVVAPNASLRIFPLPQLLGLTPGPRTWTWSFALQTGRVDVELPKTGRNAVLSTMGKLSAIVTAGHAAFRVDSNEATAANQEGDVRTLLNDHWQTVPLGWQATLSKDDPNAIAKPGMAAPTLKGGQRMWFSPSETVAMHGFRWNAVPGAQRYDLRIRRQSDGKVVDLRATSSTEWAETLTPVEPGKYELALRSVDARGLEGGWSPEAEVRVIGVLLPPGGYSTEQAIFLGVGQQVQFTNIAGLEMTYLGAGRYFPAAEGAALYRGQTTVLGFRMPGALETAVARLEPRAVYADVRIGPKRAIWPRDPISIDIQLKSKTGGEIPAFLQAVPTVTLGTDPVDVDFEQEGNTLHAVIPPSSKPGPWVVRVDVADQYGVALGHDFLEIASEPRKPAPAVRVVVLAAPAPASAPRRPAAQPSLASSP
ncbi:MAG TPA: hypothetical protein VGF76_00860 [Polyangiaceae bacterium]